MQYSISQCGRMQDCNKRELIKHEANDQIEGTMH